MTTRLFDTLEAVAHLLDQLDRDWALVGGLAVSAYVEPRFTRDIDIVLSVDDDPEAEDIVRKWRGAGFEISSVIEQNATDRLATVRSHRPGGEHEVVVDLIFASSGIEPEIAEKARPLELAPDLQVPVAKPGHLVALKLLATDSDQRPQDEADLQQLKTIVDDEEKQLARAAVNLIEQRGFHRGRDLEEMLDELFTE